MKKKVTWAEPKLQNMNSPFMKGRKTFKEVWDRAQKMESEQQQAIQFLNKAMPAMVALLEYKLRNHEPLVVMRPLRYQTSEIQGKSGDAVEDNFYNVRKSEEKPSKFVDVVKEILPGTQLVLKSIDPVLSEFVFEDHAGTEHAISFEDRNKLMTQTNVFEEVKKYIESNKGE